MWIDSNLFSWKSLSFWRCPFFAKKQVMVSLWKYYEILWKYYGKIHGKIYGKLNKNHFFLRDNNFITWKDSWKHYGNIIERLMETLTKITFFFQVFFFNPYEKIMERLWKDYGNINGKIDGKILQNDEFYFLKTLEAFHRYENIMERLMETLWKDYGKDWRKIIKKKISKFFFEVFFSKKFGNSLSINMKILLKD